jgi:ribonuclease T1
MGRDPDMIRIFRTLPAHRHRRSVLTAIARQPATSRPRRGRLLATLSLLAALVGAGLVAPAVLAPSHTSNAYADVYSSCTSSRCADARAARTGWQQRGYPTSRGWYQWTGGRYSFAGGQYSNYEGELPSGATYYEYDVYPRAKGAHRDAYRIVVDIRTKVTWFSPNHYTDFYRL